jgi:ring-1,2-phenylacetyl-CoA epoxidase subunit PaaD
MVTAADAKAAVAAVVDPEIRVVTVADLGILRDVTVDGERVTVTITPTYSGCPAMDVIRADIRRALAAAGCHDVEIVTALRPAWSTDWISEAGRSKLAAAGIAPPGRAVSPRGSADSPPGRGVPLTLRVRCPRCGSPDTRELSRFGATACKSLWRCQSCAEPFEHVKTL